MTVKSLQETIPEMTVKEFMEWFTSEFDGYYLPADLDHTIDRLHGYCLAKKGDEDVFVLESALQHLREAQNLLSYLKLSGWKYGENR